MEAVQVVILAAGRGTRMNSDFPKVLHRIGGRPLIDRVVDTAGHCGRPLIVVSPDQFAALERRLGDRADLVVQPEPQGTGDAVRSVPPNRRSAETVAVLSGDVPLLRPATLDRMLATHRAGKHRSTVLTFFPSSPRGLGRIARDDAGAVQEIIEEKDFPGDPAAALECNAGVYVFTGAALWPVLDTLSSDNAQGEFYLTDAVERIGGTIGSVTLEDPTEALGINDRRQLAEAERIVRQRTLDALMESGVTIVDPATTYIEEGVRIGRDATIHPMTVIRGATTIGDRCEIGPMAQLRDMTIGNDVQIGASYLEESDIADGVSIGQYNRVRPKTKLGKGAALGNHAEVKNSSIGARTRIQHFSSVLDSDVGDDVNIGAGTVTCNYDGTSKHRTIIEDGVFVGTDSILVAPLTIGERAYIGAGSVITRDVPASALAVERARQTVIVGWADRNRRGQVEKGDIQE